MHARVITLFAAGFSVAVAAVLLLNRSEPSGATALPTQTVRVGEINITMTPHHIDNTGAQIDIALDTHTTDLDMDLTGTLLVDGRTWRAEAWSGDGPSGHHRAGAFRFTPDGTATGTVTFMLGGFDEPVSATWNMDEKA